MTYSEILNLFNPTGLNNTTFNPLFTILASYCAAFLLSRYSPKNRIEIYRYLYDPYFIIINILLHTYDKVFITTDYNSLKLFYLHCQISYY